MWHYFLKNLTFDSIHCFVIYHMCNVLFVISQFFLCLVCDMIPLARLLFEFIIFWSTIFNFKHLLTREHRVYSDQKHRYVSIIYVVLKIFIVCSMFMKKIALIFMHCLCVLWVYIEKINKNTTIMVFNYALYYYAIMFILTRHNIYEYVLTKECQFYFSSQLPLIILLCIHYMHVCVCLCTGHTLFVFFFLFIIIIKKIKLLFQLMFLVGYYNNVIMHVLICLFISLK